MIRLQLRNSPVRVVECLKSVAIMKVSRFLALLFLPIVPLFASPQDQKIEYGAKSELRGVKIVFIDTGSNLEFRDNAVKVLQRELPEVTVSDKLDNRVDLLLQLRIDSDGDRKGSAVMVVLAARSPLRMLARYEDSKSSIWTPKLSTVLMHRFIRDYKDANNSSLVNDSLPGTSPKNPSAAAVPAQPKASGTAFLLTEDGMLATNWHVVADASKLTVEFPGHPQSFTAHILRRDVNNDLALLQITPFNLGDLSCRAVPLQSTTASRIKLGARVFAIGFPLEGLLGSQPKYTDGVISSRSGIDDDPRVFQITVPVQPGNSGSPLFTEDGYLAGVVVSSLSAKFLYSKVEAIPQNVNFAVKVDYLESLRDQPITVAPPKTIDPEALAKCVAVVHVW